MGPRLHQETDYRGFAESPAGFQPMKTFDQDQALAVLADQYRRGLATLEHAFGDFLDSLGIEGLAPLHRNIDLLDGKVLVLQHGRLHTGWKFPSHPFYSFRRTG